VAREGAYSAGTRIEKSFVANNFAEQKNFSHSFAGGSVRKT